MEVVVVEFLVAAEARRIADERAPVGFIGEERRPLGTPIRRADGQEVLQRGLQSAFAFAGGLLVAELLRDRQEGGPFAELLAEPVGVAGELRGPRQVGRQVSLELGAVRRGDHRQGRQERREERGAFEGGTLGQLHRPAHAAVAQSREVRVRVPPLVRVEGEQRAGVGALLRDGAEGVARHDLRAFLVVGPGGLRARDMVMGAGLEELERARLFVGQHRDREVGLAARLRGEARRAEARPGRPRRRIQAVDAVGDFHHERGGAFVAGDHGRRALEEDRGFATGIVRVDER